jgi:hypothetical protein
MATASNTSVDGDSNTPSEAPKLKYIPPARRSSGGESTDSQSSTTWNDAEGKKKRPSTPKGDKRSPSPKARTPKSRAQSPTSTSPRDKTTDDQVEIWQGKRKGGNRAPKIEPEGTKSWRTRPLVREDPDVTLTSLDLDCGDTEIYIPTARVPRHSTARSPIQRWPEYISEFLDIVDMHLNVLVQCITPREPREPRLSFRTHPPESPACRSDCSDRVLPRGMFQQDFENLGKAIMEGIYGLPAWSLFYLLDSEKLVGKSGWTYQTDLECQLYQLAAAQFNEAAATKLLETKFHEIPPHERDVFISRQFLLSREQTVVLKYIFDQPGPSKGLLHQETAQLAQDLANRTISEDFAPVWNVCLHHHWLGKLNGISNYPALLEAAGLAKRLPLQLLHPMEPSTVYNVVGNWLERVKLEKQMEQWDVAFEFPDGRPPMSPEWSEEARRELHPNEFEHIDWARNLTLNRNWRNQFLP